MKICKRCNIELKYYKPSSGAYYICVKCNDVSYPSNDIDKVVDRGRD